MKINILLGLSLLFLGCGGSSTTTFLDIRFEDVDKVALHWKEHPYHNPSADYIELGKKDLEAFIDEFNRLQFDSEEPLANHCYELMFYYVDGTVDKYDFDGHRVVVQHNNHHYACVDKENLITKYWGILEKDFCVGTK